jgi:CRISPR system Cascade subunit CasA
MNLLTQPLLSLVDVAGRRQAVTLPGLFATAMRDDIEDLPAARPHQRAPLQAFLTQIGALAMLATQREAPPEGDAQWAAALRKLTPDFPDDEPWTLVVADLRKPALLQPPIPEGTITALKDVELTPDAIDYLVTSKNHDVKAARIAEATPEHWFLALLTLQTMEGFLGAGNHGVSRMNGGFASRPLVSLAPTGGFGALLKRDLLVLVEMRRHPREPDPYAAYRKSGGLALLWLDPWDGIAQLRPSTLDPYYVEICRRVRLVEDQGRLIARRAGSKAPRIAAPKELNGVTGDPFAPIDLRDGKKGRKPLTIASGGFDYKLVAQIISRKSFDPAPLQEWRKGDESRGLTLRLSALARGQGETNGLHERIVPLPSGRVSLFGQVDDPFAALARERVEDAGAVRSKALNLALLKLFQNAPESVNFNHAPSKAKAAPFLEAFDRKIDAIFYDEIGAELNAPDEATRAVARHAWLDQLRVFAREGLEAAQRSVPLSSLRRYTTVAAARDALETRFRGLFDPIVAEAP